jgi:hypothetical protein
MDGQGNKIYGLIYFYRIGNIGFGPFSTLRALKAHTDNEFLNNIRAPDFEVWTVNSDIQICIVNSDIQSGPVRDIRILGFCIKQYGEPFPGTKYKDSD